MQNYQRLCINKKNPEPNKQTNNNKKKPQESSAFLPFQRDLYVILYDDMIEFYTFIGLRCFDT